MGLTSIPLNSPSVAIVGRDTTFHRTIPNLLSSKWSKGVCVLLALELIFAQLAITSPQLHEWGHGGHTCGIHDDHTCSDHSGQHQEEDSHSSHSSDCHVCAVTLISIGIAPEPTEIEVASQSILYAFVVSAGRLSCAKTIFRPSARAPPGSFR